MLEQDMPFSWVSYAYHGISECQMLWVGSCAVRWESCARVRSNASSWIVQVAGAWAGDMCCREKGF